MDFAARMTLLAARLRDPLPGLDAHREMAPPGRIPPEYDPCPPGARESSVLILLAPGVDVVFIRRAEDGRRHSGQIAFPGGIREPQDADRLATALRETDEEIGVRPEAVTVIGQLTPVFISVSGITVQPFVGVVDPLPVFRRHPGEVEEVIVLPLRGFPAAVATKEISRNGHRHEVPCYRFRNAEIWGATAMITAELLRVCTTACE